MVIKTADITLGEICCIKATNRDVLISAINEHLDTFPAFYDHSKTYLHVELSGEQIGHNYSVDYPTEADIPTHSVPCICGNPNHWMIKYEDK